MQEAVIVSAVRTAVGKAPNGALRGTRPDELAAAAIAESLRRAPAIETSEIDDVIMGCAMPEAEQGLNVARIASLRAGIPVSASAVTVNRFCSSGLQAIAYAAERVMCGFAAAVVAGGTESMSLVPMGGHKMAPNPWLVDHYADVYLTTGLVAENHAHEAGISRDEQDAFALRSHQRALEGWDSGFYESWVVPVSGTELERDENIRPDTSLERLARLKPSFVDGGTVTAGNSSPLNDGAGALLISDEAGAEAAGQEPLARVVSRGAAAVDPDVFGIAPVEAAEVALRRAGIGWSEVDVVELNEAFASQCLADIGQWKGLDPEKVNPHGGAIALGHPLGASGVRILGGLAHELSRRGGGYGVAALCIGVGQGLAVVLQA